MRENNNFHALHGTDIWKFKNGSILSRRSVENTNAKFSSLSL